MSVEPIRKPVVYRDRGGNGGGLERRVKALEISHGAMQETLTKVQSDTSEILSVITATKGLAAFAKKHGPRAIAFVTGTLAAAGIGNPAVWRFIAHFFG